MAKFDLEPFFPDTKLNPQGWITDFITSRLRRVGSNRSDLANLLYDESLTDETIQNFKIDEQLKNDILTNRKRKQNDKSIYLNPKYYDAVERNSFISARTLETERKIREYYNYMINIKPHELASFVPYVNIIYAYKKSGETSFTEASVPFIQNLSQEASNILADKFSRGQGAGVRSVSANRSFPGMGLTLNVEVTVTYFFSSLSLLTKKITTSYVPEEANFSYSKLFSYLNSKKNKIILEYGQAINKNDTNISYKNKDDVIEAEKKRLVLKYKNHKLSIQEAGTVEISVTYMSESEAQLFQRNDVSMPGINFLKNATTLPQPQLTILNRYNEIKTEYYKKEKEIKEFEQQITQLQQVGGTPKQVIKTIEQQKEALKKSIVVDSKNLLNIKKQAMPLFKEILIKEIIKRRQMFSIAFTSKANEDNSEFTIETYLSMIISDAKGKLEFKQLGEPKSTVQKPSTFKDIKINNLANNQIGVTEENLYQNILVNLFDGVKRSAPSTAPTTPKTFGNISFFPLKALLSIMFDLLETTSDDQSQTEQIPYVCFGNVVARSFGKEYMLNIGDILIERETFASWLYKNFDQVERSEYSFVSFLKDVMEDLVPNAIEKNGTGFYARPNIGTIRHLTYYTTENVAKDKAFLDKLYKEPPNFKELASFFVPERRKDAVPVLYYTQMLTPLNDYTSPYHRKYIARGTLAKNAFNLAADSIYGIPHVLIGSATGLVKKINFNAIEQAFLASSLAFQSIADGNTRLPRLPYKVDVEMFGNNLFNQAGFLAIPPFTLEEESVDSTLGITGYYVVTKVSDQISTDGAYQTSISATWHVNPLADKNKKSIDTTKNSTNTEDLLEYINFTVVDYIKDLLELDPSTLKALGITARINDKPKKTDNQQKQQDKPPRQLNRPRGQ